MTKLVLNGLIGLLLGLSLHLCRVDDADAAREALALHRRGTAKALLWAAGSMAVMIAGLMWLAVIDVDEIPVLPLTGRVLAGGAIAGVSLGLTGFTPETALAGIGGGRFTESLCAAAGCLLASFALPWAQRLLASAEAWFQPVQATLFRVTLDERPLLSGGFLAQGCIGLGLCLLAVFIRRWQPAPAPAPVQPPAPVSVEPADVQEETIVVTLPGEEPVVVDTEETAADPPEEEAASAAPAPDPSVPQEEPPAEEAQTPQEEEAASAAPAPDPSAPQEEPSAGEAQSPPEED